MNSTVEVGQAVFKEKGRNKPIKRANPLSKGMESNSLRKSINAHCYQCMGGLIEDNSTMGRVTRDIKNCSSICCPLKSVRPYQRGSTESGD